MFSNILDTDFIKKLEKKAIDGPIKKDRERFMNLYIIVEKYISDNNLILSDVNMLKDSYSNKEEKPEPYKDHYEIYCQNPFRHANNLINTLASMLEDSNDNTDYGSLLLRTSISHLQLNISYDGRPLVRINALSAARVFSKKPSQRKFGGFTQGTSKGSFQVTNQLISPIEKKGFYTEHIISMMPYELEMVNIYKQLYSPEFNECWENLIDLESTFFHDSSNRMKEISKILGGRQLGKDNIDIISLRKLFLFSSLPFIDFVLIGSWATKLIKYGQGHSAIDWDIRDKLQIISPYSIYDTFEIIKKEINKIIPESPFNLQYVEQKLYLPNEHRLKKYTVKVLLPCQQEGKCPVVQKTFMDIFTNAEYELVPWVLSNRFYTKKNLDFPKNVKIGNAYVLLRFIFIDIWNLRILYKKNILPKNVIISKINQSISLAKKIRNPKEFGGIINKTFASNNYIGAYYSDFIYFKNKIQGERLPQYYPYQYKKKNGSYRSI